MASERSKPIPGTIGIVFGGLWAIIAATALTPGWRLPMAIAGVVVTIVLVVRLWRTPAPPMDGNRLFGRRAYQIAVILEVLAIYAASAVLPRLGLQDYFLQAVGLIVGLHFIGLYIASGSRRFLGIAAGMSIVSVAATAMPQWIDGWHVRDAVTGLGNALALWIGASLSANSKRA